MSFQHPETKKMSRHRSRQPKPSRKQQMRAALARQAQESRGVEFPEPEDVPTLKPMG